MLCGCTAGAFGAIECLTTNGAVLADVDSELRERIREIVKDASTIHARALEASEHVAAGDLDGVALVLGLVHYPLSQVADEVAGALDRLAELGVRPGAS